MDLMECVKYEQVVQRKILEKYQKAALDLPNGGLSSYKVNGNSYYKLRITTEDGYVSRYLGNSKNKTVRDIKTKHFLNSSIDIICENLKALEYMSKHYKSYNPNVIASKMRGAYQCLPEECFKLSEKDNIKGWGSEPYEKSNYYAENLKHKSIKGDMVRSKSELNIVDMAYIRKLEYRYEQVLYLNGYMLIPDITIMSPITFQPVYHEHAGLFKLEKYRNDFYKKIEIYRQNGIVPWKNLIITYDDEDGNIDIQGISKLYDVWFGQAK